LPSFLSSPPQDRHRQESHADGISYGTWPSRASVAALQRHGNTHVSAAAVSRGYAAQIIRKRLRTKPNWAGKCSRG
jgi:hypothetical protein